MNWFHNLKTDTKLIAAFIVVVLIGGLAGYIRTYTRNKVPIIYRRGRNTAHDCFLVSFFVKSLRRSQELRAAYVRVFRR